MQQTWAHTSNQHILTCFSKFLDAGRAVTGVPADSGAAEGAGVLETCMAR
jgi:hypothetical protein